jgi:hypothetical protein
MEAYRHNNLVYVPIPKHASQSYVYFFTNVLFWDRIETEDINWNHDHIFAHLIHPYTRHTKGIVQALYQNNLEHLVNHADFSKLLATALFDHHSYPITRMFSIEQCYKIDWLLLDQVEVSGEEFTKALLADHGIDINIVNIPRLHQQNQGKKVLETKLLEIHKQLPIQNSLIYLLENDVNLYNKVNIHTRFCEINNMPWKECSWITNYTESPTLRA